MLKHIIALSAALGITLAFAIIHAFPPGNAGVPPAPAARPAARPPAASSIPGPANWQHYRVTFVWTAPATNVYLSVSPDGQAWQPCGIAPHPATNGTNTLYLLLPANLLADAASPRLRIGTADRRYGFTTALPQNPQTEAR